MWFDLLFLVFITTVFVAVVANQVKPTSLDWPAAKPSNKDFMTAVKYDQHGDPNTLQFDKAYARPIPNRDQVLVQVKFSSVNPVDFKFRRNMEVPNFVIPKPKIPGGDFSGVVVEVGSKVAGLKVGDRVAALLPLVGSRWGSAAEYVAVKESFVSKIDGSIDFEGAAAIPLVGLTSVQALNNIRNPKGKKILIHAGAGGVGTFAIQYAKKVLGMYVATTASKPKAKLLKKLGADVVVDYRTQDFTVEIQDYDVVLDTMGFAYEHRTLNQGSKVLKPDGHYINILSSDWELVNGKEKTLGILTFLNLLKHKVINIFFSDLIPKYDVIAVYPDGRTLQNIFDLLKKGEIRPVVDKTLPLAKLAEAHDYLERGHASGKVVIKH